MHLTPMAHPYIDHTGMDYYAANPLHQADIGNKLRQAELLESAAMNMRASAISSYAWQCAQQQRAMQYSMGGYGDYSSSFEPANFDPRMSPHRPAAWFPTSRQTFAQDVSSPYATEYPWMPNDASIIHHPQVLPDPAKRKQPEHIDSNPSDAAAVKSLERYGVQQRNIWQLSRSKSTTQKVQEELQTQSRLKHIELAEGLKSHAWEASKDPNANHVIQAFVEVADSEILGWIVEELSDASKDCSFVRASKHRFQCRVIQRMLEYFPHDMTKEIVEAHLRTEEEAVELCNHAFGNYVMSCLLTHQRTTDQVERMMEILRQKCSVIGADSNGANVIGNALTEDWSKNYSIRKKQLELADTIVMSDTLLLDMGKTRHGHATIKFAIQLLLRSEVDEAGSVEKIRHAINCFKKNENYLKDNRYGRATLKYMNEELPKHWKGHPDHELLKTIEQQVQHEKEPHNCDKEEVRA
jgi:hypothetical protein